MPFLPYGFPTVEPVHWDPLSGIFWILCLPIGWNFRTGCQKATDRRNPKAVYSLQRKRARKHCWKCFLLRLRTRIRKQSSKELLSPSLDGPPCSWPDREEICAQRGTWDHAGEDDLCPVQASETIWAKCLLPQMGLQLPGERKWLVHGHDQWPEFEQSPQKGVEGR